MSFFLNCFFDNTICRVYIVHVEVRLRNYRELVHVELVCKRISFNI